MFLNHDGQFRDRADHVIAVPGVTNPSKLRVRDLNDDDVPDFLVGGQQSALLLSKKLPSILRTGWGTFVRKASYRITTSCCLAWPRPIRRGDATSTATGDVKRSWTPSSAPSPVSCSATMDARRCKRFSRRSVDRTPTCDRST